MKVDVKREQAVDAVDVLNDLIGDFQIGAEVIRHAHAAKSRNAIDTQSMIAMQKMCISHIVLAFAKFTEFWEHYHEIVPTNFRIDCKTLLKDISSRGIPSFRNKCVGHVWDIPKQRPLKHSEIDAMLRSIVGDEMQSFVDWIYSPSDNKAKTVVSTFRSIRDAVCTEYSITEGEVVDR